MPNRLVTLSVFVSLCSASARAQDAAHATRTAARAAILAAPARSTIALFSVQRGADVSLRNAASAIAPEREAPGRFRHTMRGALIGGALGLAAGAVIGSQVGTGCYTDAAGRCSTSRNRAGLVLGFGATGAVLAGVAGGVIGTVVGAVHRPTPR